MDYNHVKLFLEKFKNIIFEKEYSYEIISQTITKHTRAQIDINIIKIKGNIIHIKGSPALRNEILIHKEMILSDINKNTPNSHFIDIH